MENKKPMPLILAAHGAYVATANIAYPLDFVKKVQKGLKHEGPAYVQVFTPCPPGWGSLPEDTIDICRLAFETKVTPLYEIEGGVLTFSKKPAKDVPVTEFLRLQGRFKHLSEDEVKAMQASLDDQWQRLLKLEETKVRLC
jgi:pyruvate/2-oxoacid:ferredoxin oxidoreductase beta subunit